MRHLIGRTVPGALEAVAAKAVLRRSNTEITNFDMLEDFQWTCNSEMAGEIRAVNGFCFFLQGWSAEFDILIDGRLNTVKALVQRNEVMEHVDEKPRVATALVDAIHPNVLASISVLPPCPQLTLDSTFES